MTRPPDQVSAFIPIKPGPVAADDFPGSDLFPFWNGTARIYRQVFDEPLPE